MTRRFAVLALALARAAIDAWHVKMFATQITSRHL